jgi:hypothetical protein
VSLPRFEAKEMITGKSLTFSSELLYSILINLET